MKTKKMCGLLLFLIGILSYMGYFDINYWLVCVLESDPVKIPNDYWLLFAAMGILIYIDFPNIHLPSWSRTVDSRNQRDYWREDTIKEDTIKDDTVEEILETEEKKDLQALFCPKCGAPLAYIDEDTVITRCEYCQVRVRVK